MSTISKSFSGVYAAVLTPRTTDARIDAHSLERNICFALDKGMDGVVLGGATGEYAALLPEEFDQAAAIGAEAVKQRGKLLMGIGAASYREAVRRGKTAFRVGAAAVLLPAPHFFAYSQDDVECFVKDVVSDLDGPVLLYNLPQFTNPFVPSLAARLISECPNVVGVKDSSGSLDMFRFFQANGTDGARIVGNDGVFLEMIREDLCHGTISGVAGVLPELTHYLWTNRKALGTPAYDCVGDLLGELLKQLESFPVPWGLKQIAEHRGLAPAEFLQPQSEFRQQQARAFRLWLEDWWQRAEQAIAGKVAP